MMIGRLDLKGVLAILVVIFSFGLFAADIFLSKTGEPDATVAGFASGSLLLVLGFYFGAHNGAVAQAADSAASAASKADTILSLAQQRRAGDMGKNG